MEDAQALEARYWRIVVGFLVASLLVLALYLLLQYRTTRCDQARARLERETPTARVEADIRRYCFL